MTDLEASRRNLLTGLAAAGVIPVLAACGSDDGDTTGTTDSTAGTTPGDTPSTDATSAPEGAIKTSDIPVGGGKIYKDDKVVVTQPAAGEFKAFSAVCTHQGCLVANVEDSMINCTCHGSKFSIEDGSVDTGPATKALEAKDVTVSGDSLTVA